MKGLILAMAALTVISIAWFDTKPTHESASSVCQCGPDCPHVAECEAAGECRCECQNPTAIVWTVSKPADSVPVVNVLDILPKKEPQPEPTPEPPPKSVPLNYADALAHVAMTGEPVTLHFYNSRDGHSAPANEYAVDVSNQSESFLAYWLGNDRQTPTTRTAKLYGDKVGSAEWYATHPSVLKAKPAAVTQVDRSAGPTWTWPGDLRSHLVSHGHSESELAGLTHEQLRILHDNDHNAETARNGRPISPAPIQQRSGCPGGICPSPNSSYSSPRSTFGWFRRR